MDTTENHGTKRDLENARAALIIKREKIGASTPIGHVISNVVEQIGNLPAYERPSWAIDDRQTLPYMLKKSLARLAGGM